MPLSAIYSQASSCVRQTLPCFKTVEWSSSVDWAKDIDWLEELRLIGTSGLITAIVVPLIIYLSALWERHVDHGTLPAWILILLPDYFKPRARTGRRIYRCPSPGSYTPKWRTIMGSSDVTIYAWPSKGGVIIHDHAERVDLDFLGLDPLDPDHYSHRDQVEEDVFCKRLLLIGAKWWESEERYSALMKIREMGGAVAAKKSLGDVAMPTMREQHWVSVAWPLTGGLWVAEFDPGVGGPIIDESGRPHYYARLRLANTMDERSQVLQDFFDARFYEDVKDYGGYAFLNSWEGNGVGNVAPQSPLGDLNF